MKRPDNSPSPVSASQLDQVSADGKQLPVIVSLDPL